MMRLYSSHIGLLVNELGARLEGMTVTGSYIDSKSGEFLFSFGNYADRIFLKFVPHKQACRLILTEIPNSAFKTKYTAHPVPIRNCKVINCEQVNYDRIIKIVLNSDTDEFLEIYFIMIPSKPDIIITKQSSQIFIGSHKKTKPDKDSSFQLPQTPAIPRPNEIDMEYFLKLKNTFPQKTILEFLESNIWGIDPLTASEIVKYLNWDIDIELENISNASIKVIIDYLKYFDDRMQGYSLALKYENLKPVNIFITLNPDDNRQDVKAFSSPSEAIEIFGNASEQHFLFNDLKNRIRNALKKNIKKDTKLLKELLSTKRKYDNFRLYRKFGDLLLINPNIKIKGKTVIEIEDTFDNDAPQIEIRINPLKSIPDNAADYYKKHKKAKKGLSLIEKRIREINSGLSKLDRLMIQLTEAEEIEQLHYIIDEDCKELGIPIASKHRRRQQSTKVGPHKFREYKIEDGVKIYIGRDGKDNDKLTFGFASKNDLWFHAQQSHGSHIILK
ncbi:MAG: hypothetical protein GY855_07140, partial [candidate division Zixibacteria bacterium]|nr:hypothetical protein [candidate division Zixibacteria bacterium]